MDLGRIPEIELHRFFKDVFPKAKRVSTSEYYLDHRVATGFSKVELFNASVAVVYIHPSKWKFFERSSSVDVSTEGSILGHIWGACIVQTKELQPEDVLIVDHKAQYPKIISLKGCYAKGLYLGVSREVAVCEEPAEDHSHTDSSKPETISRFQDLEYD